MNCECSINKINVKSKFTKSISTYNKHAIVQKDICLNLIKILIKNTNLNFENIFEIGCGTGFLTEKVIENYIPKHYFVNDIVDEMQNEISNIFENKKFESWTFLNGDAENIEFPKNIDLALSASTIQWFENFEKFIFKLNKSIKKGGIIAISTFGQQNFREIKQILNKGLDYLSNDSLKKTIEKHFKIIHFETEIKQIYFDKPLDILKHIKFTGVNGNTNEVWCKCQLIEFEENYNSNYFIENKGVSLTYEPIYIIAQKI